MKSLLNKALIYMEWKNSKINLAVLSFQIVFLLLVFFGNQFIYENEWGERSLHVFENEPVLGAVFYVVVCMLILMTALSYYPLRKNTSYTLIASMPFKREEIIRAKWLFGILEIVLPFTLIYIIMNLSLVFNYYWTEGFMQISMWFIASVLLYTEIYSFLLMTYSFCGSIVAGSIISFLSIFSLVAFYIMDSISSGIPQYLIEGKLYVLLINEGDFFLAGCSLLIIFSIVFYKLAIYGFRKNEFEKNGDLLAFKGGGVLLRVLISYYMSYFLFGILYSNFLYKNDELCACLLMFAGLPAMFYLVIGNLSPRFIQRIKTKFKLKI